MYEESRIDGILCCRSDQDATWKPVDIAVLNRKYQDVQEELSMEYLTASEAIDVLRDLMETINHERKTGLCQGSEWIRPMDRAQALLDKY